MLNFGGSGGPKYREHFHDFKAAVFGYSAAGALVAVTIHTVVFASPIGNLSVKYIASNLGLHWTARESVTVCGTRVALDRGSFNYQLAQALSGNVSVNGQQRFVFDNLEFATDKAEMTPSSQQTVNDLAKILRACTTVHVRLDGYTDSTGDAAHNKQLSEERAAAVKAALIAAGVDEARLASAGYGAANPIADNATDAGRAKNRRTELFIVSR